MLLVGCADSGDACELPPDYLRACSDVDPCAAGWECVTLAGRSTGECEYLCDPTCLLPATGGPCECSLFETSTGDTIGVCRCPDCPP